MGEDLSSVDDFVEVCSNGSRIIWADIDVSADNINVANSFADLIIINVISRN